MRVNEGGYGLLFGGWFWELDMCVWLLVLGRVEQLVCLLQWRWDSRREMGDNSETKSQSVIQGRV